MKKVFQISMLAVAAVMTLSSASFAQQRNAPTGHAGNGCFINHDASLQMPADQFFNYVAQQSRGGVCTYGKLEGQPGSGRMYFQGKKVLNGATNSQGRNAGAGNCVLYTCYQFGPVGNDTSQARGVQPPPATGGGWN